MEAVQKNSRSKLVECLQGAPEEGNWLAISARGQEQGSVSRTADLWLSA